LYHGELPGFTSSSVCDIHTKPLTKGKSYPRHFLFSGYLKIVPTECICCQCQYKLADHVDLLILSHNSCGKKKIGQQAASLNRKIGSVVPCVVCNCCWFLCFTCQQRFYFI